MLLMYMKRESRVYTHINLHQKSRWYHLRLEQDNLHCYSSTHCNLIQTHTHNEFYVYARVYSSYHPYLPPTHFCNISFPFGAHATQRTVFFFFFFVDVQTYNTRIYITYESKLLAHIMCAADIICVYVYTTSSLYDDAHSEKGECTLMRMTVLFE